MQFFEERGERENIFTQRKDKTKKRNRSPYLARAFLPPRIIHKKMAFALQINAAAATKKKTAAPKKTTVKKVR